MPQIAAPFLLSSRAPVGRRPSIFWRLTFRLAPFITWNMESHSNLKMLGVRDDETPQTNPRPILPRWARFASGVSSRKKTISLIETLTPWVFLSSFDSPAGDEGFGVEGRILKNEKGFKGSWGFAAGPFARESERLKHYFIFSVRKAWFRIPNRIRNLPSKSWKGSLDKLTKSYERHQHVSFGCWLWKAENSGS
jgi:hypothetical protein